MLAKLLRSASFGLFLLSSWGMAHAQETVSLSSSQRDSLDHLRQTLLAPSEARPKYGYADIDRLFRYEPPAPYNVNRGYDFLRAFAASQVRSREASGGQRSSMAKVIDLAVGKNFDLGKWQLGIDGVANIIPGYNRVDGQWLGYELQLIRFLGEGRSIRLRTSNNYALRTQRWYTENNLLLYYAPQLNGLFLLSGGQTSRQTAHTTPEEIYRGYFGEIQPGNSPVRDYVKTYLAMRHRLSLSTQLDLSASLLFEDRRPQAGFPLSHHRALIASGQVLWAPSFLNRSATGTPIPIGFRRELGLSYREAFHPGSWDTSATPYMHYRQLDGFVRGTLPFDVDNKLHFKLSYGRFLDRTAVDASDEKYFPRLSWVGRELFRDSWSTLPAFFTGGKSWTTQEFTFSSNNLALARTKGFGEVLRMDEAIHARQLFTQDGRAFSELGYSLGWGELARFGLFGGYDWRAERVHVAFRISLPILTLTSSWSERR